MSEVEVRPFADTKEVFGGFYLIEADDLDQATAIAARIPAARIGGSVEIRPVVIDRGMRVAQLVIGRLTRVKLVNVDFLDVTQRGDGGFGSTGA